MKKINRKPRPPISDPLRHAEKKHGVPFLKKRTVAPWEEWISRHTTGEFASLGKGYKRHCGPTAVTNMILSLNRRYHLTRSPLAAKEIFLKVARLAQKRGIYWNTEFLNHFGGTSDLLTPLYLHSALRNYHIPAKVSGPVVASRRGLLRDIEDGALIYLQLYLHPIYGSHHLLCYGYTVLRALPTGKEEIFLVLADGWNPAPRYLPLSELYLFHYYAVR